MRHAFVVPRCPWRNTRSCRRPCARPLETRDSGRCRDVWRGLRSVAVCARICWRVAAQVPKTRMDAPATAAAAAIPLSRICKLRSSRRWAVGTSVASPPGSLVRQTSDTLGGRATSWPRGQYIEHMFDTPRHGRGNGSQGMEQQSLHERIHGSPAPNQGGALQERAIRVPAIPPIKPCWVTDGHGRLPGLCGIQCPRFRRWWGGWGSNPRPKDYESSALTD
jgi:hypothetical protein